MTNLLYELLCKQRQKNFLYELNKNEYHPNEFMTEELYNFWFNQEAPTSVAFKQQEIYSEILYPDTKNRMIEFKWYDKNLNVMIENNTINKIKNWQNKIKEIKDDLEKDKIFKINMYPNISILMTKIMHT